MITVFPRPTRVALAASPVALGVAAVPPLKSTVCPSYEVVPPAPFNAANETKTPSTEAWSNPDPDNITSPPTNSNPAFKLKLVNEVEIVGEMSVVMVVIAGKLILVNDG